MVKIADIKDKLINEYNFNSKKVSEMTKDECIAILNKMENEEGDLNLYEIGESINEVNQKNTLETKKDIMDMFEPDEMFEKYPTLPGLRRVASNIIGDIVSSTSEIHQVPSVENGYRATIKHRLVFNCRNKQIIYDGCADAGKDNTGGVFSKVLVAMAETRAEARAYRRALNVKTPAFEEMDYENENNNQVELAASSQISVINIQCERLGININKFLAKHKGIDFEGLKNITAVEALELIQILKQYRNNEIEIPEEIKS